MSVLMVVPMLAAYGDDYPHTKCYVTCQKNVPEDIDLTAQEVPLQQVVGGQASLTRLQFPDNFFDLICAGYCPLSPTLIYRSLHLMVPKPEWNAVLKECLRVLKPGYPPSQPPLIMCSGYIDLIVTDVPLKNAGPVTKAYETHLQSHLAQNYMHPSPGSVLPSLLRTSGFTQICRTQLLLPTFWRDETEQNKVCIPNVRTGEKTYMTMSEIGDRFATLMYGFWEEIFGEFNDDLEDFGERNRVRRREAEEMRTMSVF